MEKETVYVIGHKSPDTDTVCSAIAYSAYLKKTCRINAVPAVFGEINPETQFVLDYFKIKSPAKLESVAGQKLVLVDHNEKSQSPDGIEEAKIIEILDHHKIGFICSEPIIVHAEPVGSTATLVAKKMLADKKFKITPQLAGLLVSAILSDTVVFKSATTTKTDIEIAKKLGPKAKIKNLKKFGIEIKKQKASLKGLTAEKIIYSDFKAFEASGKKFGIGQIEVVELGEAKEKKAELLEKMAEIAQKESFSFMALMITDIINEGSEVLIAGDIESMEKAFGKKVVGGSVYLEKAMSRKKDILPPLMKAIK
ncbi:MAG: manganese-dependent inorganic pyrophosphatase [Candidatus Paceibacterota bacterium]|jgi:manganese-dependent inorganic pyrophosphatase